VCLEESICEMRLDAGSDGSSPGMDKILPVFKQLYEKAASLYPDQKLEPRVVKREDIITGEPYFQIGMYHPKPKGLKCVFEKV